MNLLCLTTDADVTRVRAELTTLAAGSVPFFLATGHGDTAASALRLVEQLPREDDATVLAMAPRLAALLVVSLRMFADDQGSV